MKILFDNGTPKPITRALPEHEVTFARQICWHELKNGDLIEQAEQNGYSVLLSTDKNIRYQQNLSGRNIAIVVLRNSRWPVVKHYLDQIAAQINRCKPGDYLEIDIPAS